MKCDYLPDSKLHVLLLELLIVCAKHIDKKKAEEILDKYGVKGDV